MPKFKDDKEEILNNGEILGAANTIQNRWQQRRLRRRMEVRSKSPGIMRSSNEDEIVHAPHWTSRVLAYVVAFCVLVFKCFLLMYLAGKFD